MLGLPDETARYGNYRLMGKLRYYVCRAVLICETLKRHQADSGLNDRDIRWVMDEPICILLINILSKYCLDGLRQTRRDTLTLI